jgi:hypothetical protein
MSLITNRIIIEFHGVDLRKMYPTSIKPANTFFKRHNFLESLPYPDNTFEFVRMRLMLAFITESQLLLLLAEIHRVLKPGGYFELLDSEYLIHKPGPTSEEILNKNRNVIMLDNCTSILNFYFIFILVKNVLHEKGIDLVASHHLSTMLMTRPTNQGFIDVHQHRIAIPIGWGGKLGDIHAQNLSSFLKSLHPTIREYICPGHQIEAIDSLIDSAIRECKTYKSHMNWFVCYGQKPADSRSLQVTPQSIKHFSSSPVMAPTFSAEGLNEILENYGPLKANDWECIDDFIDGYVD